MYKYRRQRCQSVHHDLDYNLKVVNFDPKMRSDENDDDMFEEKNHV